jgi:hypothetical protein
MFRDPGQWTASLGGDVFYIAALPTKHVFRRERNKRGSLVLKSIENFGIQDHMTLAPGGVSRRGQSTATRD